MTADGAQPVSAGLELCGFNLPASLYTPPTLSILRTAWQIPRGQVTLQDLPIFETQQAEWNPIIASFVIKLDLELLFYNFRVSV